MILDFIFDVLEIVAKAMTNPKAITDKFGKSDSNSFQNNTDSDMKMNNNIYAESENSNIEYNKIVPMEDNKTYNDNYNNSESNSLYNKQLSSSNPQGVIDSIAQELTSARLKQAIILSEIVGKPRSKTRKKRRF